jgi:hypothetical protein
MIERPVICSRPDADYEFLSSFMRAASASSNDVAFGLYPGELSNMRQRDLARDANRRRF